MSTPAAAPTAAPTFSIVIPTVGRPQLSALLASLSEAEGPAPEAIFIVDDRPDGTEPIDVSAAGRLGDRVKVLTGKAAGPASARNVGWRACTTEWVAFLDDDVLVPSDWLTLLAIDLDVRDDRIAATQGRIEVPLPTGRRPTDWERNVAGLESAHWATADMAYRRSVLVELDGFDERFPRAYREDADLGLRTVRAGYAIVLGDRFVRHPVRPADRWVSLRLQRGNADDPLMRALHGPDWRREAVVPRGRFRWHVATLAAAGLALVAAAARRPAPAAGAGALWLAMTATFAWNRIAPGPRTSEEITTMAVTSALLPPVAVYWRMRGVLQTRALLAAGRPAPGSAEPSASSAPTTSRSFSPPKPLPRSEASA